MALEESFYDEVKRIVLEINNITGCPNCGGNFEESTCIYCETKDNNLDVLIVRLKEKLEELNSFLKENDINELTVNRLFNLLYSISITKIDNVNKLLEKYNYYDLYDEFYLQIIDRMKNSEDLSQLEINTIETIIEKNIPNYDYTELFKLLTKRCLEKKNNVSLEYFVKLVIIYTNSLIKNEYPNPKCNLFEELEDTEDEEALHGASVFNKIYLNKKDIVSLYEEGNVDILYTIYHEYTHTLQYSKIFKENGIIDPLTILELKDYILFKEKKGYYNTNYKSIAFEKEARYFGKYLGDLFLHSIGHCNNVQLASTEEIIAFLLDSNRVINGISKNIDEIFDEYILLKPELLIKYPQLKIMYIVENNEVRRKTQLELTSDYESLNDEEKEGLNKIYTYLNEQSDFIKK